MFLPHFKPLTTNDYVDLFRSVRFCQLFPIQNRTKFRVLQSMNGYQTNGGRKRVRFVRLCCPIDFVGLAALICVQCAIERLVDHCIIKRDNNLSTGMKQNACEKKLKCLQWTWTWITLSFSSLFLKQIHSNLWDVTNGIEWIDDYILVKHVFLSIKSLFTHFVCTFGNMAVCSIRIFTYRSHE